MASSAGCHKVGNLHPFYNVIRLISPISERRASRYAAQFSYSPGHSVRRISCATDSTPAEFSGPNAYELLGVSETSSFKEIKASFYKLAKETHPDLSKTGANDSASRRFIQILAAYEILSDSDRRAHYDRYLLSQRTLVREGSKEVPVYYTYESYKPPVEMEVVEWLKWYRCAVSDIVSEKRVVVGSGYFDELERDFYSAMHTAYFGPEVESLEFLPDCFEAEERSGQTTAEVLHLVSGRDLFGVVRVSDRVLELSHFHYEKLKSSPSYFSQSIEIADDPKNLHTASDEYFQNRASESDCIISDAYKDLELHIAGKLIAVATRNAPVHNSSSTHNEDLQDCIKVYLISNEGLTEATEESSRDSGMNFSVPCWIPLGSISGLGTSPDEGCCYVYSNSGVNTHIIMKHRTFLVKHMHWYQVGDRVSVCECRSTRAQLPPSRFWLFEPRSWMHDIGGWYVETFGRDLKGRSAHSRRYWDGLDANEEQIDKRLHPAMYLLALGYRTLDIEYARRNKKTVKDIIEAKVFRVLSWCKKLV